MKENFWLEVIVCFMATIKTPKITPTINPNILCIHSSSLTFSATLSKKFLAKYPNSKAYELDAFHPKKLQELVKKSIEKFSDVHAVVGNIKKETEEQKVIDEVKDDFHEYITDKLVSMGLG